MNILHKYTQRRDSTLKMAEDIVSLYTYADLIAPLIAHGKFTKERIEQAESEAKELQIKIRDATLSQIRGENR